MVKRLQRAKTEVTAVLVVVVMMMMLAVAEVGGSSSPCPSKEEEVPMEELVFHSDVVVLGRVERRLPDKGASLQLYKVEMRVFCIYKGHNLPRMINISAAGNLSDPCPAHQMEAGHVYMAYLYKHGHAAFIPAFRHHPDTYKDELFILCDLNVSTPAGPAGPEDSSVKCIDDRPDYDEEEPCIRYTPKPGDSAHREKKAPNQPGKTGKVEGDGEDGDAGGGPGTVPASLCVCTSLALWAAVWMPLS